MKGKSGFLDKLDLVEETSPGQTIVEICGDTRVIVEHHGGVQAYSTEKIRLRVRYGSVEITGQDLLLRKMCGRQLVITGVISSVLLDRGG